MVPGEPLDLDVYLRDYEASFWTIKEHGFWKLERQQRFKEPGFGSWEAFAAGRWDEALVLLETERPAFESYFARLAEAGIACRRVRVVEEPIAPYLQWELHVLRLREQCGEYVRVVGPEAVAQLDADGVAPELITLGTGPLYQILYSEQGILAGAVKFASPETVTRCRLVFEELYAQGKDLATYFERVVAHLEPPRGE